MTPSVSQVHILPLGKSNAGGTGYDQIDVRYYDWGGIEFTYRDKTFVLTPMVLRQLADASEAFTYAGLDSFP